MKTGMDSKTKKEAIENFNTLPAEVKKKLLASSEFTEAERDKLRFG